MPRRQEPDPVPAIMAPPIRRDNPFTRSAAGMIGTLFLVVMVAACLGSLPWTVGGTGGVPLYNAGAPVDGRLPPAWASIDRDDVDRLMQSVRAEAARDPRTRASLELIAAEAGIGVDDALGLREGPVFEQLKRLWPRPLLGTDHLGRSLLVRVLTGGGISLGIGIAAALLSVCIGTLYGALAGYAGGKTDALMMRIVDVLYGLPYILLVVLLAVAGDALITEYDTRAHKRGGYVDRQIRVEMDARDDAGAYRDVDQFEAEHPEVRDNIESRIFAVYERVRTEREARRRARLEDMPEPVAEYLAELGPRPPEFERLRAYTPRDLSARTRAGFDIVVLFVAIGGVSWLTMARVVRGQVLSLKNQPFIESARAIGAPTRRIFARHLLPNLVGPIIVYATLAVPQAILQESFLSFLGIGVKPPLPSWGNLAAEGLSELNQYKSHWWLLFFPCLLLGLTLLALNFVGEGLREALDPKRARR